MPKAYSYIRFSTPEQRLGDSLRRQLEAARNYAAEQGLELDESLRDEGRSAYKGKHRDDKAALGSFLKAVEKGRVERGSYLLVESLDRLSREQVTVALRLFLHLIELGLTIVTLADKRVYSDASLQANPTELIISIVVMMRAHEESETKGKRVGAAWANKRILAETEGRAMTRICPGWMQLKEGRYELIPERVDIVRRILRECIGGSGTRSIASGLNSDGVQTWGVGGKKGSHWHDSYVKKILENPALVGEYTPRSPRAGGTEATSGATLVGYYPAVTDRETWLSARAAMRARATSSVRAPAGLHRNVLSGLLKCHACGGGLHYIDKGRGPKAGAPYLQCGNSLMKGGCTEKAKYNYESTESALLMTLATNAVDVRDETVDVAPFMGAVTDAQATVERLLDLVATGVTSGAAVARRIAKAEADLAIAQTALAKAEERRALAALQPLRRIHIDSAKVAIALRERPDDREYRAEVASRIRAVIKTITLSPYKLRVLLADETTVIEGVVNLSYAGVFNLAINRFSRMNPDIPGVPSRGIKLIPPRINTWEVIEESNRVDAEKDE